MNPKRAVRQFEAWERARKELEAAHGLYEREPTPENEERYMASLKSFADLVLRDVPILR